MLSPTQSITSKKTTQKTRRFGATSSPHHHAVAPGGDFGAKEVDAIHRCDLDWEHLAIDSIIYYINIDTYFYRTPCYLYLVFANANHKVMSTHVWEKCKISLTILQIKQLSTAGNVQNYSVSFGDQCASPILV